MLLVTVSVLRVCLLVQATYFSYVVVVVVFRIMIHGFLMGESHLKNPTKNATTTHHWWKILGPHLPTPRCQRKFCTKNCGLSTWFLLKDEEQAEILEADGQLESLMFFLLCGTVLIFVYKEKERDIMKVDQLRRCFL